MRPGVLQFYSTVCIMGLGYCCFFSCNNPTPVKALAPVRKETTLIVSDSSQVKSAITDFLRWYKLNYTKANTFPFLTKDKAGNFKVNQKAYTDYLNFLSSSHLIGPKYIAYWKKFFVDKEAELRKNKIKSDIPDGFDLDFVLITQEPEIILNKIDSIHLNIGSINDSAALVGMRLPSDSSIEYEFEMYKTRNTWQIGYISTPNYD